MFRRKDLSGVTGHHKKGGSMKSFLVAVFLCLLAGEARADYWVRSDELIVHEYGTSFRNPKIAELQRQRLAEIWDVFAIAKINGGDTALRPDKQERKLKKVYTVFKIPDSVSKGVFDGDPYNLVISDEELQLMYDSYKPEGYPQMDGDDVVRPFGKFKVPKLKK